MNKNIITFRFLTEQKALGQKYQTDEMSISISNKKYLYRYSLQENASDGKLHTRISYIKQDAATPSTVSMSKYKEISELLMGNLLKIETHYLMEKIQRNQKAEIKIPNGQNLFIKPEKDIKIDLSQDIALIPSELNEKQIESIIKNKENLNNILKSSLLKQLQEFHDEWNKLIKEDGKEQKFQDILKKNPIILQFIFPKLEKITDIEYRITNKTDDDNRIDIVGQGDQKIIIELKRPSSNMFIKNGRNNMSGVSSCLITSVIQLSLYNKRMQNESDDIVNSFTYGILIYGNDDQINSSKENQIAWRLFKEQFHYEILTFTEISKIVQNIIENLN